MATVKAIPKSNGTATKLKAISPAKPASPARATKPVKSIPMATANQWVRQRVDQKIDELIQSGKLMTPDQMMAEVERRIHECLSAAGIGPKPGSHEAVMSTYGWMAKFDDEEEFRKRLQDQRIADGR